jgi:hypothetical protein
MDGAKVLIDSAVLERVDASQPPYLSRTSWVNHLLDCALTPPSPDRRTVDAVLKRAETLQIVGDYVDLERNSEGDYLGKCPTCNGEMLVVNPEKNYYYCVNCGSGGNAIKWLMERHNFTFNQAIVSLAERYNIKVSTVIPSPSDCLAGNQKYFTNARYPYAGDD